jgi:hypothetical protein
MEILFQVFIGETLSARVSHLHIRPNTTQKITKTKSSGLCVSTGTGSTSWHTSINRLSKKNVEDLLGILKGSSGGLDGVDAEQISEEYNRRLVFQPGKIRNEVKIEFKSNDRIVHRGSKTLLLDSRADLRGRLAKPQRLRVA